MRIVWTIVKRELSSYFSSPVAYVFLVIFLLLTGFFTFTAGSFFERGEASLAAFFGWHPWLYLVLVPAVGMRLWAEERRAGTLELLLTMPITPWQAIIAKFLASWAFLAVALALTFPAVITVWAHATAHNARAAANFGSTFQFTQYAQVSLLMVGNRRWRRRCDRVAARDRRRRAGWLPAACRRPRTLPRPVRPSGLRPASSVAAHARRRRPCR